MIKINQAPGTHRYRAAMAVGYSITGPTPLYFAFNITAYATWGNPWDPTPYSGHGMSIHIHNELHSGVYSHEGYVFIPALNFYQSFSGAGWINPDDCVVTLDEAQLNTDCVDWEVVWSGIDISVLGSSIYSDSDAVSMTGTKFDQYFNTMYGDTVPDLDLVGPPEELGCLSCLARPFTFSNYVLEISGDAVIGWDHDGSGEAVDWDTTLDISPDCPCDVDNIVPSGTDSWTITIPSYAKAESTKTLYVVGECLCDGVYLFDYPIYHYESWYTRHLTRGFDDPEFQPNRKTVETGGYKCWSSGVAPTTYVEITPIVTTRAHAMSRYETYVENYYEDVYCPETEESPPICVPGVSEPSGILTCTEVPDCNPCGYIAYKKLDWIDTFCEEVCVDPSQDVTKDLHHFRMVTCAGTPTIHRRSNANSYRDHWLPDSIFPYDATNYNLRTSKTESNLWVAYRGSDNHIHLAGSTDQALTWDDEDVAAGVFCDVATFEDNFRTLFYTNATQLKRKVYDGAGNVIDHSVVLTATIDKPIAVRAVPHSETEQVEILYIERVSSIDTLKRLVYDHHGINFVSTEDLYTASGSGVSVDFPQISLNLARFKLYYWLVDTDIFVKARDFRDNDFPAGGSTGLTTDSRFAIANYVTDGCKMEVSLLMNGTVTLEEHVTPDWIDFS